MDFDGKMPRLVGKAILRCEGTAPALPLGESLRVSAEPLIANSVNFVCSEQRSGGSYHVTSFGMC